VLGELPRIPLEDRSIDRAVAVNVIHEIEDLALFESEVRRCLRKGGRLTIVDFPKRETSFGPPLSERLSEEDVLSALPYFHKVKAWSFPEFYQLELSL
jgi:ubiquinone/menaquinone biosynthesis C-methylase UbiE